MVNLLWDIWECWKKAFSIPIHIQFQRLVSNNYRIIELNQPNLSDAKVWNVWYCYSYLIQEAQLYQFDTQFKSFSPPTYVVFAGTHSLPLGRHKKNYFRFKFTLILPIKTIELLHSHNFPSIKTYHRVHVIESSNLVLILS